MTLFKSCLNFFYIASQNFFKFPFAMNNFFISLGKLRKTHIKLIMTIIPISPLLVSAENKATRFDLMFEEKSEPIKTKIIKSVEINVVIFLIMSKVLF
jgi:hypothetical protein